MSRQVCSCQRGLASSSLRLPKMPPVKPRIPITVSEATLADLRKLHRQGPSYCPQFPHPSKIGPDRLVLVAKHGDDPAGYFLISRRPSKRGAEGWIHDFSTRKDVRNMGIAASLFEAVNSHFDNNGFRSVFVSPDMYRRGFFYGTGYHPVDAEMTLFRRDIPPNKTRRPPKNTK